MTLQTRNIIWKRIGATVIDYGLTFFVSILYLRQFGEYDPIDNSYSTHGFKSLPLILYWLTYHVIVEYLIGRTLGHWIFGLRVLTVDGNKTKFVQNLKRHLIDPFEINLFGIPAIISINNTDKHQRIGDLWAKTVVVETDYKIHKNFYSRPEKEQEWLIQNTWCDRCNKADLGLENPSEFEQNEKHYLTGFCNSCGRLLKSEIKEEISND